MVINPSIGIYMPIMLDSHDGMDDHKLYTMFWPQHMDLIYNQQPWAFWMHIMRIYVYN